MFGLEPEEFADLAGRVDVIFHSGALVNFLYPYSEVKAPNVDGTETVLRLATTTTLKAVHHVSTIDVWLEPHGGVQHKTANQLPVLMRAYDLVATPVTPAPYRTLWMHKTNPFWKQ